MLCSKDIPFPDRIWDQSLKICMRGVLGLRGSVEKSSPLLAEQERLRGETVQQQVPAVSLKPWLPVGEEAAQAQLR